MKCTFRQGGHPTTPQSTIRDQAHLSAGPTRRVFHHVQHREFPHLDQRKAHTLLCTLHVFWTILALREELLPSQTTSHQLHE